jgi:hypothetical protein
LGDNIGGVSGSSARLYNKKDFGKRYGDAALKRLRLCEKIEWGNLKELRVAAWKRFWAGKSAGP